MREPEIGIGRGEIEGRYQSERTCEMTIMEPSGAAARQSKGAGVVRDFTLDNYALRLMEKKGGDEDFDEWLAIFETMVEIWEGLPDDFEFCAPSPSRASEFDSDTELWPVLGTEGEENDDGVLHENSEG